MALFFPMFVDISHKRVLIVGSGEAAADKVRTILDFAGSVTVVTPEAEPDILGLAESERITLHLRRFSDTDLESADIAIIATGHSGTDIRIAGMCRRKNILVNVASDETLCDFYFPGIARRDPLVVGVTFSGEDAALEAKATAYFKNLIEKKE